MRLKKMREIKKMTLLEVCNEIEIAPSSLNRYENLKRFPDAKILKKFKGFYNISDEDIARMFLEYFYKNI